MANKTPKLDIKELQAVLELSPSFWEKFFEEIIYKLIEKDMDKGILQGEPNTDKYRSRQYVKYKQNYMNRFTNRAGAKGSKLKSIGSASVVSNHTTSVNMKLTGQLIRGLHFVSSNIWGGIASYSPKDTMKIVGNLRYGRVITTLNKKNREVGNKFVSKELGKKITKWAKIPIIVKYGAK